MQNKIYTSNDYIIAQGIFAAINDIIKIVSCRSLNSLFDCYEDIHKILSNYESHARTVIRDSIKNQCLYRYKQYKEEIISNRQFLYADLVQKHIADTTNLERSRKCGLCACIEEAYYLVDHSLSKIKDEVMFAKGGIERVYVPQRYMNGYIFLKNSQGRTFVFDRNSNKGFVGYFRGKDIISDSTQTVCDDMYWTFAKEKQGNKTVYELI